MARLSRHLLFVSVLAGAATLSGVQAQPLDEESATDFPPAIEENAAAPRNVILIIGDGMDDQQITIARNYLAGAKGRLTLDSLPLRGVAQVRSVSNDAARSPVYVSDSANTATAIATGEVTSRGRISTTAGDDRDVSTLVELASAGGLRTGVVTTASVTDATPAAFLAHISFRQCENPERMAAVTYNDIYLGDCKADMIASGGPGSISEQLASSPVDILLGGGLQHFTPTAASGSGSVLELAERNGFKVVQSPEELERTEPGERVLGLFAPHTLPVMWQGEDGRIAEFPKPSVLNKIHSYLGSVEMPAEMGCEPNPAFKGIPTLKQMTDAALAHLATDNTDGFFLMVESASVDKAAHEFKPCGSIGEMAQLEQALESALDFASNHPDTLVLVTADHAQAAQLIPETSIYAAFPVPIYSPGRVARIRSPEGSLLVVNYATNNFAYGEHTGAQVPVYANDLGIGRVPTYLEQQELFTLIRDFLALNDPNP